MLFKRDLILRIRLDFLGGLPFVDGLPCSYVYCSRGFSEVFGRTELQLQEIIVPGILVLSF